VRLGVLGGTFDPPHVGHLILAEEARTRLRLEKVLFVPAGDPWRKASQDVTPAEHRVAMVRLMVVSDPYFEVSTLEVERQGPSYTVDTLEALRRQYGPGLELYFILGEDALYDLPHWKEPGRILSLAWLAIAPRAYGRTRSRAEVEAAVPGLSERVVPLPMPTVDISSTALRKRARAGLSLRFLVPLGVEEYIRHHGLYARNWELGARNWELGTRN
jgi:nicotinate-nucleotide adenylyltransferase